ncbi:glutathionylspermidine synthase family protein [Rossellomorea marisflavi]|uniref:glutathionylspermidine synthase family protein n=1 Tax=Rossellomorea marisflavi TaxID=189381 RepID=UPI003F9FF79F
MSRSQKVQRLKASLAHSVQAHEVQDSVRLDSVAVDNQQGLENASSQGHFYLKGDDGKMEKTSENNYTEERTDFYNGLTTPFWADLDNVEYATLNVHALSQKKLHAIEEAILAITPVFKRTAELVRLLPDEMLIQLGYPQETLSYLKLQKNVMENTIGRFDVMFDGDTPKIIEFNADTPTFIKELFHISGELSSHFSVQNINKGEEKMLKNYMEKAIEGAIQDSGKQAPHILFVANQPSKEDYLTIQYLANLVDCPYAPIEELEIVPGVGLFHDGRQVDILYRQTWAMEIIAQEVSPEGERIGHQLIELIEQKLLEVINPPASFLLQNKMLLALMWQLTEEDNPVYTSEMKEAIKRYIPKSYFFEEDMEDTNAPYIQKPIFGREGNSVSLLTGKEVLVSAPETDFQRMPQLCQEYVPSYMTTIETNDGVKNGNLVFGAFVLGLEHPSAIGARFTAGEGITGNNALFVAVTSEERPL